MKDRRIILAIIIALVIAVGFLYVLLMPKNHNLEQRVNQEGGRPTSIVKAPASTNLGPGTYANYSDATFAETAADRRILFFHAAWCPQCRELEKSIQNGDIPSDIALLKVDYDNAQQLRQKYGVTLQTTLVEVDANGNEVKKFVAYDEPTLEAVIRAFGE